MPLAQPSAVVATDGTLLDLDSLPCSYGYTGADLTTMTVTVTEGGVTRTYVQTFTYSGGVIQSNTGWEKQ